VDLSEKPRKQTKILFGIWRWWEGSDYEAPLYIYSKI